MNEEKIKGMKFGETVSDGNGNKYTKTIGGWIYSTFAGQICFIPEVTETKINIPVSAKELDAKTKKTKVEK
jgi:hypothetical protein